MLSIYNSTIENSLIISSGKAFHQSLHLIRHHWVISRRWNYGALICFSAFLCVFVFVFPKFTTCYLVCSQK